MTSASGTGYTLSQYRSGTIIFFQHQCLTNTKTVSQQTCGPLELLTTIADCDQSFRSANLINCDHSDSTHSFYLWFVSVLDTELHWYPMQFPRVREGPVITDSIQDCSTETNPHLERNSLTRNPIQHKVINFIYFINYWNFVLKLHLVSLQTSYKWRREVNRHEAKQTVERLLN